MERTGALIKEKYREYFFSTLAMSGSTVIANIIDRIMVGNLLGAKELAAISYTGPVVFAINVIYGLFIYGGNTLSVTYKGHRDKLGSDKCFTIAIAGGTLVSILLAVIGLVFLEPLAGLLSAGSEELYKPVVDYLLPLLFMGILVIPVNGTAAFIRSDGLKKLALALPVLCNAINLIMDFVFMGIMGFGIGSAGWATNVGFAAALLLLIPYFRSKERSVFFTKPGFQDISLVLDIFYTGLASALLNGSILLKSYVMNVIALNAFKTDGAVIISVCMSANSMANIFYMGTSQTMMPIGGGLYGERDWSGIRQLLKISSYVTLVICVAIATILMAIPQQFAALFGIDAGLIGRLFDRSFRLFCVSIPFVGLQNVARSYLQSCGHKNAATVLMVLDGTVCFIPFIWLLSVLVPQLLWLSFAISPILSMLCVYIAMRIRLKKEGITDPLLLPAQPENERILEFTIGSTLEQTSEASERVLGFCRKNGIPDTLGNKMWLAVQELCSNISQYAYGGKPDYADLFLKITDTDVVLRIRDNGIIFDPTSFIDDSGREITGLGMLRALNIGLEYNRVLGFNNTIVTLSLPER